MKWVVYLLLAGNAAFFAWQYHDTGNGPVREPRLRPAGDPTGRMLLLSEVKNEKLRVRNVETDDSDDVTSGFNDSSSRRLTARVRGEGNCFSVGPLKEDSQIAAMRTWLIAMGGDPMLRVDERRELERYWVYFPPLPSREEAAQRVERMRSEGLRDIQVVTKGDMADAISLGVFSRRDTLERRLKELKRLGYEPSIRPSYRVEKASWFDVSFDEDQRLTPDDLTERFPGAELTQTSCVPPEIARGGEGP